MIEMNNRDEICMKSGCMIDDDHEETRIHKNSSEYPMPITIKLLCLNSSFEATRAKCAMSIKRYIYIKFQI